MAELQWEDDIAPGNEKYPAILASIKQVALSDGDYRHSWAKVATFESEGTARDLASRLTKKNDEFYVIGRKTYDEETRAYVSTEVWARLKETVND